MYISGMYPNKQNITITININSTLILKLDILTKVGIVDTGNFILVTK